MSNTKVERRVDTVLIEMDSDLAEKLTAVMGQVIDNTSDRLVGTEWVFYRLFNQLADVVREPSPRYEVVIDDYRVGGKDEKAIYIRDKERD